MSAGFARPRSDSHAGGSLAGKLSARVLSISLSFLCCSLQLSITRSSGSRGCASWVSLPLWSRSLSSALRPNVIWPGLILTAVYRPLRVVSRILHATDCLCLICLIRIGEFFDAYVGGICDLREALSVP